MLYQIYFITFDRIWQGKYGRGLWWNLRLYWRGSLRCRRAQRTAERLAEPGGNVDRERFLEEVLEPLGRGEDVHYRRFDCGSFTLMPEKVIHPGRVNLVEGAYAMHPDLAGHYALSLFLRVSPEEQRRRILARNGERAEMFFTRWIPFEERYFREMDVERRCDLVIHND